MIVGALRTALQQMGRADFWRGVLAYLTGGLAAGVPLVIITLIVLVATIGFGANSLTHSGPAAIIATLGHLWPVITLFVLIAVGIVIFVQSLLLATGLRLARDQGVAVGSALGDGFRFYRRGLVVAAISLLAFVVVLAIVAVTMLLFHTLGAGAGIVIGLADLAAFFPLGAAVYLSQITVFAHPDMGFGAVISEGIQLARRWFWPTIGFLFLGGIGYAVLSVVALLLARYIPVIGPLLQFAWSLSGPLLLITAQFAFYLALPSEGHHEGSAETRPRAAREA